jgi:uncharacterized protein (DUF433 family)
MNMSTVQTAPIVESEHIVLDAKGRPTLKHHPRVRLTRIVEGLKSGLTIDGLMEHWPFVGREEFESAILYFEQHRSEIEQLMEREKLEFDRIWAEQAIRNTPLEKVRQHRETNSSITGGV